MDLRLTDEGDMFLEDGFLEFVIGQEAIGQHISQRLQTWLGETPYDLGAGVPYLQVIFASRNPNLAAVRFIIEAIILGTPGVISVVGFETVLNNETRELSITGTATTIEGNVDFSQLIKAAE